MVPTHSYVPVRRGFSTLSERVSTRWSTGKIQPSFWMTPVRPAASTLANIAIDSLLVAFSKLTHVIGGIYMCVRLYWQESVHWYRLQQLNLSWETVFTAYFELDMLRRKRPYKWTIWVSSFHPTRPHDHFSHGECSYTLECATLLFLLSSTSSSSIWTMQAWGFSVR